MGGVGSHFDQTIWFLENSEKKTNGKVMSAQVTSSGHDYTYKNIYDRPVATAYKRYLQSFHELITASVPTKRMSQKFDFSDLSSDQCCDLTIIRLRENVQMPFIPRA